MIGTIALGQCGGNIGDLFVEFDFPTVAINFSQSDLDSLENVENKMKLWGSEGCGKDRMLASQLMKNNWENTIDFIKQNFSSPSIEVLLVVYSTGGGSGSGLSSILLELLSTEMPDKVLVACPILPDLSESIINQANSLQALNELQQLDICVLPIDNEKVKSQNHITGKNRLYQIVNQKFVKLIYDLVSYTDKHSKHGVLDKKDLLQIFKTKGIGIIAETNLTSISNGNILDLSHQGFADKINESWENSIFTPIEYNSVMRAGVIFDGQESFMEYINHNLTFNIFKKGMPLDLFESYYSEQKGKVLSILTGLQWCNSRIKQIEELIENKTSSMTENEEVYTPKTNMYDITTKLRQQNVRPKQSAMDILSKYQR